MHTVLRILAPADKLAGLAEAARLCGAAPRARRDGYVVDLCETPLWADHSRAVLQFVRENTNALADAKSKGATLTVDVAIWPEDMKGWSVLTALFNADLVASLSEVAAQLAVSVYAGDPDLRSE